MELISSGTLAPQSACPAAEVEVEEEVDDLLETVEVVDPLLHVDHVKSQRNHPLTKKTRINLL